MRRPGTVRRFARASLLALILAAVTGGAAPAAEWKGVDETVVERFAEQAGRAASRPMIDTDQGDLLLFLFLLAGAAGGFTAGYFFHRLFGAAGSRGR